MNEKIAKKVKINSGFTLIELLVAMAVFLVVITMVVQIFLLQMNGAWRLFGRQNSLDAARFILESASKELRMSGISQLGGVSFASLPDGVSNGNSLQVRNSARQVVTYVFSGTSITRNGEVINSADVEVMNGSFYVVKNGTNQPRVTMVMGVRNKTSKAIRQSQVNLQTTVSSRQYGP